MTVPVLSLLEPVGQGAAKMKAAAEEAARKVTAAIDEGKAREALDVAREAVAAAPDAAADGDDERAAELAAIRLAIKRTTRTFAASLRGLGDRQSE
ncbi:unnamed protein product [Amoebophrya sp. A25]|nr:unnamed protein product [Amoebophrya sp. A25]|eukprot:GSA25T00026552001.1